MSKMESFEPLSTSFLSCVSTLANAIAQLISICSLTLAELMTSLTLRAGVRPTDRILETDREQTSCYKTPAS